MSLKQKKMFITEEAILAVLFSLAIKLVFPDYVAV
jgi:hypothetical protein